LLVRIKTKVPELSAPIEVGIAQTLNIDAALEHDPEKWKPVFRKDHAQTKG
jgi:hypothetical protein